MSANVAFGAKMVGEYFLNNEYVYYSSTDHYYQVNGVTYPYAQYTSASKSIVTVDGGVYTCKFMMVAGGETIWYQYIGTDPAVL